MNERITHSNNDLFNLVNSLFGAKLYTMSIDWLYNPIKAISEKAILFTIDGYHESITVQKLLNMVEYSLL